MSRISAEDESEQRTRVLVADDDADVCSLIAGVFRRKYAVTVAYDADGKWEIRLPKGKPGDYMTMTALMPQIVAISNCPILFNACNNYKLKPLTLEILK